jgi:hypothetical protein
VGLDLVAHTDATRRHHEPPEAAWLVPELDAGAVAEVEPEVLEPDVVEPEVTAEPPEVAAADEELLPPELELVLAAACVEPGRCSAIAAAAARPPSPIVAVVARSRDLPRSRAATALATSSCRLLIASTLSPSSLGSRLPGAAPGVLCPASVPAMKASYEGQGRRPDEAGA